MRQLPIIRFGSRAFTSVLRRVTVNCYRRVLLRVAWLLRPMPPSCFVPTCALRPLPEAELRAIRQSTRELAAIGRNLNQIAHASHQGAWGWGKPRESAESAQGL